MLFFMIFAIALAGLAADVIRWFTLRRSQPGRHTAFIVWALATDLLPVALSLAGVLLKDNTQLFMTISMWVLWLWMVTVLPRLVYYLFLMQGLRRTGIAVAACLMAVFVWGATDGRTRLIVSRVSVCSERLPACFDGFRIVQLTDIHLGTLVRPERELRRIVDSVNALRPDLVVFTGDLINIRSEELDQRAQRLLGAIKAPYGVVSVIGNHDIGSYIKDTVTSPPAKCLAGLIARQEAMGWRVLQDSSVYLVRGQDSISVSGLSFDPALRHRRHDAELPPANLGATYKGVPERMYNITAVHLPQLWDQITAVGRGDVTLSGHVHAMQFKLRLFGRTFSPAQWLYENWSGRYDKPGHTLYISDGTGYVAYPMRLGSWPEITLITLHRCE